MAPRTLLPRALNRALLARQRLLERSTERVPALLEHLVGLQAQEPGDPYVALFSRLEGFTPSDLAKEIQARRIVRLTLMRGTIHLVTARDAFALRPLVQAPLDRLLVQWRKGHPGVDSHEVAKAGRRILAKQPMTYAELAKMLAQEWPKAEPQSLARAVQALVPLVQVPPRGIWGQGGAARHTPLETWVRDAPRPRLDLDALVRRYLAAYGPASVKEMQAWSGLTRLDAVFQAQADRLVTFAAPDGTVLYDLASAPRPDPKTKAPPRLLPVYENFVIGLRDRSRFAHPTATPPTANMNENVRYGMVDGVYSLTWKAAADPTTATLDLVPYARITKTQTAALAGEGRRLLDALWSDRPHRTVHVLDRQA